MMHAFVLGLMVALLAAFGNTVRRADAAVVVVRGQDQASGMALYRDAVILYFTVNPAQFGRATAAQVSALLPNWSTQGGWWGHYRGADGTIAVYALRAPDRTMIPDLLMLSQNSLLVGQFNTGDTYFRPSMSNTASAIPMAQFSTAAIPAGSPLWLAYRN